MKTAKENRIRWAIPVLAAAMASVGANAVLAQPTTPATKPDKPAKAPKPKSKLIQGSFSQANATGVKVTTKDGEMSVSLTPKTEYWRIEEGLAAADLKVGEMVKFSLKGTDDMATVQSLAPLALKFGEIATLTFAQTSKMKFDRVNKLMATDLVAGQMTKAYTNLMPDGKMEAREVWVIVKPTKTPKAPKKTVASAATD